MAATRRGAQSASAWEEARRQTAAELLPGVSGFVDDCVAYIQGVQPELGDDPELAAGLYASAYDNFAQIFSMLADGRPVTDAVPPPGAIGYAEIMVRRGQPLQTLLRAYRLGTMFLWRVWREEIAKRLHDPEQLMEAVDHSMQFVFDYVDIIAERVTEEYGLQRERWARSAAAIRHEIVLDLLSGEPVAVDVAESRLGYALRRHHLGLVLWGTPAHETDDVIGRLEGGAQRLASTLGARRPLLVPDGRSSLWCWIAFADEPESDLLERAARGVTGARVASGEPAHGPDGFVRTHLEALQAREVAERRSGAGLVRYERVVVQSLLLADDARARRFVERELRGLAADDDVVRRLRATLAVFFEEEMRTQSTARRLGVHGNTVTYRLRQAEELLGGEIAARRYEIETALRLLGYLGE